LHCVLMWIVFSDSHRWTHQSPAHEPVTRSGHTILAVGHYCVAFGGKHGKGRLNDVHLLDTSTMRWQPLQTSGPLPVARNQFAVCFPS